MRDEGRRRMAASAAAAGTSTAQGMRVTRRAMGGRRAGAAPSTPVPSWRVFNNQLYDGVLAARAAPPPASARRLAASLRELQLLDLPLPACLSACVRSPDWRPRPEDPQPATPPGRQTGHDFGVSAQTRDHLRKLLRKTASMESVERQRHVPCALFGSKKGEMEEGSRTMSQELLKVFSQIRVLEEEHSSSLSLTSALHAELVAAHVRVRELEAAARREKAKEKERARELEEERATRARLEGANRRLARELADAQAAAAGALQELESERRARRLMEEVCQELVQETGGGGGGGGDKAEVEELKRESQKVREELEEERRMLQLAEVWREERVQMKLGEAKLALEEKSAALDVMKDELESFLRATHDGDDDSHVRDAQVLHEVIHAISAFPTSEYVPEASSSSSLRKPRDDAPVYYAEGIPDAD